MATDKYGRTCTYVDGGFGWGTLHVLGANSADDGERAFTLDWRGDAPGEEAAIRIAEGMQPGWWVDPASVPVDSDPVDPPPDAGP